MKPLSHLPRQLTRWLPFAVFMVVVVVHALYLRHVSATPAEGWADSGVGSGGWWDFAPYFSDQDYLVGISYALGAAFSVWALVQYLRTRKVAMAAGAAGGITLVGALMAAGCFLVGCCGSPMLGVYLALFGCKSLGAGKPLMASLTFLSVAFGYWYLTRRSKRDICADGTCACNRGEGKGMCRA